MTQTRVTLDERQFDALEKCLVENTDVQITTFRFASGTAALRVRTRRSELVILPFQGQQIWSVQVDGHSLGMKTVVETPVPSGDFLANYGGFLVHCGITGIGAPGAGDVHPLHGELPNAAFQSAYIDLASDAAQGFAIGGSFEFARAFSHRVRFSSSVKVRPGEPIFELEVRVENLTRAPMDYMYLAHLNFLPVDGGRLVYSATYDSNSIRVRGQIPGHLSTSPSYRQQLEFHAARPNYHHRIVAGDAYDPEVVFLIDYLHDAEGWTHSMQVHPSGDADYVSFQPASLPRAVRWLSRTEDQQGLGLVFPTTSGIEGYAREKAAGSVPSLEGGASWAARIKFGRLSAERAEAMEQAIDALCGRPLLVLPRAAESMDNA